MGFMAKLFLHRAIRVALIVASAYFFAGGANAHAAWYGVSVGFLGAFFILGVRREKLLEATHRERYPALYTHLEPRLVPGTTYRPAAFATPPARMEDDCYAGDNWYSGFAERANGGSDW